MHCTENKLNLKLELFETENSMTRMQSINFLRIKYIYIILEKDRKIIAVWKEVNDNVNYKTDFSSNFMFELRN